MDCQPCIPPGPLAVSSAALDGETMGSLRKLATLAFVLAAAAWAAPAATYRNPLPVRLANGEPAQNCADPAALRDPRAKSPTWYLYCTSDPVSKNEKPQEGEQGDWHFHMIAIDRSTDLVDWRYVGDAFADRPAGLAAPASGLWAPEPAFLNGHYYLYFTVTDVPDDCCKTAVQAGVVVMRDDDDYVKLVEMAHGGPHQVEFAKELAPVPADYPRYGNTVAGTPGTTTWLRLDVHRVGGDERYTAYSSRDGKTGSAAGRGRTASDRRRGWAWWRWAVPATARCSRAWPCPACLVDATPRVSLCNWR